MSMAFEINEDDVMNVLSSYHVEVSDIEDIMAIIDDDEVAQAALAVDYDESHDDDQILEMQTEAAYDEIAYQLFKEGYIKQNEIVEYGNTAILYKFESRVFNEVN